MHKVYSTSHFSHVAFKYQRCFIFSISITMHPQQQNNNKIVMKLTCTLKIVPDERIFNIIKITCFFQLSNTFDKQWFWIPWHPCDVNTIFTSFEKTPSSTFVNLLLQNNMARDTFFSEKCNTNKLNSLRPNSPIWRHHSGSTWAQVMACCLTAPNH